MKEDDGDIIVTVRDEDEKGCGQSVQFCTGNGGGHYHRTWLALVALFEAMERDSETLPHRPCPNEREHTSGPGDYGAWSEWAKRMAKTHDQLACPGCGLFKIWKRRQQPRDSRGEGVKTT